MGAHVKGGDRCWCGGTHEITYRCLANVPFCNCDGTPLSIGGPMPDECSHVHSRAIY